MIRFKRVGSILLSFLFLLGSTIHVSSVYAKETKPKEQIEKYMGLLRYVSYSKGGTPNDLYGYVSDTEEKIEVGKEVSFTSLFPASSLKGKVKEYELVSVEPYTPDFHFGASIYDDSIIDSQYPHDYFPVYPYYLESKQTYQENYVNYSVLNLRVKNPKLTEQGITAEMSCVLGDNGIAYVEEIKRKIPNANRYIDNHLYALVGGKANADAVYRSALERLRGKSKEQLDKEGGYIWFVPYVITLKKKDPVDLIVYDGDYTHENNKLCYEYKVKLEGSERVENVPVRDHNKEGVIIPLIEKDKPVTIKECVAYPNEKPVKIDIFVNPNKDTPPGEKTYENNRYQAGDKLDLSVVAIDVKGKYPPNTEITVPVKVKSTSPNEISTSVSLSYKGKKKSVKVRGEEYVVFEVTTPGSGCMNLTAEINKSRTIKESNYSNNKKTVKLCVEELKETPSPGGCPDSVEWEEMDWRWEEIPYESCYTDSEGKEHCSTKYKKEKVWYKFVYKATLKASLTLKDDRAGQVNAVVTKAGYGIKANVSSRVEFKQISGAWKRPPKQKPKNATSAVLETSWKVKKIHKQPKTISLRKSGDGQFVTPINPSSKNAKEVIYTDIDLADGTYSVSVQISGATAGGKPMCKSTSGSIKIRGDMYEDYKVN